jgi:hypothetical protein
MRNLLATLLLLTTLPAMGQELGPPPEAADVERRSSTEETVDDTAAPRPPDGFQPENPEVRILTDGDKTIEEYSINGQIYMIKVKKKNFPAYYLIDRDGDGRMDEQVSELAPGFTPPSWVLFRW